MTRYVLDDAFLYRVAAIGVTFSFTQRAVALQGINSSRQGFAAFSCILKKAFLSAAVDTGIFPFMGHRTPACIHFCPIGQGYCFRKGFGTNLNNTQLLHSPVKPICGGINGSSGIAAQFPAVIKTRCSFQPFGVDKKVHLHRFFLQGVPTGTRITMRFIGFLGLISQVKICYLLNRPAQLFHIIYHDLLSR